jgi:hypothetical protein
LDIGRGIASSRLHDLVDDRPHASAQ